MNNSITTAEFKKRLYEKWQNEYHLLGKYNGSQIKITIIHEICQRNTECLPDNAIHQKIPCKWCNPNSQKDTEIFKYQLDKSFPGEYQVLSQYTGCNKPIEAKHLPCNEKHTYKRASGLLKGMAHCPYCHKGSNQITASFKKRVKEIYGDEYSVTGDYISSRKVVKIKHNICNREYYPTANDFLRKRDLCGYCTPYSKYRTTDDIKDKIIELYNGQFILSEEFTTCNVPHNFLCTECNQIVSIVVSDLLSKSIKGCPNCGDNFYYPEKFLKAFLDQLGISYIFQFTCKNAEWCKRYRYDFYLPEYNWIIETHGPQHYRSCFYQDVKDTKKRDSTKKRLAKKNGINKYIIINCEQSNVNHIKSSIEKSALNIFDLNSVDWNKCDFIATKSIYKEIISAWNQNKDMATIMYELHISDSTFYRALKLGESNNLLTRSRSDHFKSKRRNIAIEKNSKRVLCVETNIIYKSAKEAELRIRADGTTKNNIACCARGKQKTAYGYHWKYA